MAYLNGDYCDDPVAGAPFSGEIGALAGGRNLQVMSPKPKALEEEKSGMEDDAGEAPTTSHAGKNLLHVCHAERDLSQVRSAQAEKFEEWSESFTEVSSLPHSQTSLRTSLAPKQEDALMNAARTSRIPSSSSEERTPAVPRQFYIGDALAAPGAASAEAMRRSADASLSNEEQETGKVDVHGKHASQEDVPTGASTSKDEVEELSEALAANERKHRDAQKGARGQA